VIRTFCLYFLLCIVFIAQSAFAASSSKVTVQINSGNPAVPFPQFNAYQNPTEKLDNLATHNGVGVTHAEMEQTIRDAYQIMMNRATKTGTKLSGIEYLLYQSDCGGINGCSEGAGYGLLGAAAMADKTTFDGLWLWIHDNMMNKVISYSTGRPTNTQPYNYSRLPGWTNAPDQNSATDGDVDMALALYIAYCQWGEFMGINDSKGSPISYKHDCIEFLKALNDTIPLPHSAALGDTTYVTGDIGVDGYVKNGDSWTELTDWSASQARTGLSRRVESVGPSQVYVDYSAPAYFHEFADFLTKENPSQYAWNITQFQRCEASCDWLIGQLLGDPRMIPYAGHVDISSTNVPAFTQMNQGEDFRWAWRTIINYLWHGNPSSTWDPVTHQPNLDAPNSFEKDVGTRYAKFLWDTRQSPWKNTCVGIAGPPAYSYWGPSVIFDRYNVYGAAPANNQGFFLNWVPGAGSSSAVVAKDFNLMAELYRYLEIEWDVDNGADTYLKSKPHYFHDIFRLMGLLTLSGNFHSPSTFKPGANMKVYIAINKTFGFEKDSVIYTIDYRNFGSLDAQNVTIVDTLHKDFVFLSAANGGVYNSSGNTVTWNIGTVPGFKTATGVDPTKGQVKLIVKVGNATQKQYRNHATIFCGNGTGWTSNEYPNNNTSVMERNYLDIAKRALIIDQTASVPIAKAGTEVQFTIDFENSSEAGWINGGRPGVHFAFSQTASGNGNATQNYMRFRLFHDAHEAYIDYNNYRVSYFLHDSSITCVQGTTGCATGWGITQSITEPPELKSSIKLLQENITPGQDSLGKWNQRLIVQFSDPTSASRVPNLATIDHHLLSYSGGAGGRIHKGGTMMLRLVWYINSSSWTNVNWADDWSWDPKGADEDGGKYWPVTNDWTDLENPNLPVDTWNRKNCETATHTVKNILVEEWDGYTWRRVAGNGPLPGRDVENVVIRDTIPAGFTFKEFVGSSTLGVSPKITGNVITWSIPKMQIKQKGTISFTATASCPPGQLQAMKVVNRSWISADKESPFSDSAVVKIICDSNFVEIPPTKSTLAFKSIDLQPISDTAKIDNTVFHVVVTDKDQDLNGKARDTLTAWITNPSGLDSLLVRLIETGEATGVFQTAAPIAIISAASPGAGSNKIHMDPGDVLWATYTDPGDPADVSQASLITLAAFPVPIRGWIIDANGDGAADSAIVIYSKPIESPPDSLRFNFPDQAGAKIVKADALHMAGTTLMVSFAQPFPKNVTGFTGAAQGSALAFIMDNAVSRRIAFPLADSVGPVITAAQAVERLTPGIDTLFVTFSEAIKAASLKGASLILIQTTGATVITIDSARQLLPNRFAVSLAAGTPQPMPKDSLRINPAGPARDLAGNGAHERNPAVIITVKQSAPVIMSAWYVDRDANGADGFVDTAIVLFNKKVNLAELSFLLDWGNGLTQEGIKGGALSFAGGDSIVAIALQPSFPYAKYIRTSGNMMATPSFTSFPGELNIRPIVDSAAPVIEAAAYYPNTSAIDACDTLLVDFSEPVVLHSGLKHFVFSGRTGISYEYDLSPDSIFGDKAWFCCKFTSDLVPRTGDSICINADNSVGDVPGIFQNNPRNRKVALKIMAGPSNLLISILRNPFIPRASLDTFGISASGTAITISSKKKNASLPDIAQATLAIFDVMGNPVHTDRFTSNGGRSVGNSYYFVWDGYNTNRRAVGAGIYIAVVSATEGSGASTKKTIKIGLKR
jgi:uncharacterized repeat protein (TIGR01451 family)